MANVLKKWVESDKRRIKELGIIADQVSSYSEQYGKLTDELKQCYQYHKCFLS